MSMTVTADVRNFIGKVYVSQHAIERVTTRFNVPADKAEQWVRDNIRKARYISTVLSSDGKLSRLFTYQRIAYVMASDMDRVVTVYEQHHAPSELTQRVRRLVTAELAKAERRESAVERVVSVEKAKLAIEVAKCNYRMTVTPSKAVLRVNTTKLREIEAKMAELDDLLNDARREKSVIARGLIPYM